MNRLLKKAFALSIAAILLLMAAFPAAADDSTIDTSKTVSLTIYKYDETAATAAGVNTSSYTANGEENATAESELSGYELQGVVFMYLKVSNIVTESTNGTIYLKYYIDSDLATILDLSGGAGYYTSDEINSALSTALSGSFSTTTKNALENYIKTNGGKAMTETDANGKTSVTLNSSEQGLYLVVETSVPENVTTTTDPFFVSLPMTNSDGTDWIYNVYVYPKNQTNDPTLDKWVKSDDITTYQSYATASEGDIVTYRIVSKLPEITSTASYLTTYTFVDTLDSGLTYDKYATIELYKASNTATAEAIKNGTAIANADATWDNTTAYFTQQYSSQGAGGTMTITISSDGLAVINPDYSGGYLVITYTVTVNTNSTVTLGDDGMPNKVTLTYQRTNTASSGTLMAGSIVYTYGIELTKKFADNSMSGLSDVKFVLYNSSDEYYVIASVSNGVYYVTGTTTIKDDATKFTPDSSTGKLTIYGLEADTYTLTETATASGYSLLQAPVTIEINSTQASITGGTSVSVSTTEASATVDNSSVRMTVSGSSNNAIVPLTISNTKSFTLPRTGGLGTILFTLAGALAVIAGLAVITKGKKKEEK
ncbi:MAG: SpaH/EbpB family LPXTG-anchored major pilin [Clostridiales bacterium]|nr:SpaH/EbpB family LPXTG-anchored major pilin [Clostridiales bacterium]